MHAEEERTDRADDPRSESETIPKTFVQFFELQKVRHLHQRKTAC